MAILHNNVVPALPTGGYTIDQSLRFEDGSSAYLSRTPASAGNRKTWTWSGWVKLGNIGTYRGLFGAGTGTTATQIRINNSNNIFVAHWTSGSYDGYTGSSNVLRDTSAWYHIVVVHDTTEATAADRIKIYINGERSPTGLQLNLSLNYEGQANNNVTHTSGSTYYSDAANNLFDGYLSEVHFIDGQALDPTSFGEVDATYGHWKPIAYTGTYGTNGFYLDFSNSADIGEDQAGSNDWTANNLAATDVVLDSPTNNFATLNPLASVLYPPTFANGNLEATGPSSGVGICQTTIAAFSGKFYAEVMVTRTSDRLDIGIMGSSVSMTANNYIGSDTNTIAYQISAGDIRKDGVVNQTGLGTSTTGDIIGIAVNMDSGTIQFYKNNSTLGTSVSFTPSNYGEFLFGQTTSQNTSKGTWNFGQDSSFAGNKTAQNNTDANGYGDFYYTPPSGFLALCTANLSEPAVVPGEHFNTVLYSGNGSTQSITGVGFQPDFSWFKCRNVATSHEVHDVLRSYYRLFPNETTAEAASYNGFVSLASDGFNLDGTGGGGEVNASGRTYVAWNWKADNTSGSSNTDGSITSTVAANPDAGFSIVSWTGTGSASNVGHGLSQAPEMVIYKNRSTAGAGWPVYHQYMHPADPGAAHIGLNTTDAKGFAASIFNDEETTATTIPVGTNIQTNESGSSIIAYCFHSVDGYSKFGSYTGNGSTDGPFVYTGFRPAFVMVKRTDSAGYDWLVLDGKRTAYNVMGEALKPSQSEAAYDDTFLDFTSNGFKLKIHYGLVNGSGGTYIFMAFAEFPFSVGGGIAR